MRKSTYDKFPKIHVPGSADACACCWEAIGEHLRSGTRAGDRRKTVLVVECYTGVQEKEIERELRALKPALVVATRDCFLPPEQIDRLIEPFLGGDDPVFGFLSGLTLPQFFDAQRIAHARGQV